MIVLFRCRCRCLFRWFGWGEKKKKILLLYSSIIQIKRWLDNCFREYLIEYQGKSQIRICFSRSNLLRTETEPGLVPTGRLIEWLFIIVVTPKTRFFLLLRYLNNSTTTTKFLLLLLLLWRKSNPFLKKILASTHLFENRFNSIEHSSNRFSSICLFQLDMTNLARERISRSEGQKQITE